MVRLSASPLIPLPDLANLVGRVAVLGGKDTDKTALAVTLALRHAKTQGRVVYLDARRHKQTEIQFRLLLRETAQYIPLSASARISQNLQTILRFVQRQEHSQNLEELDLAEGVPPLLLLDGVRAGETLELFLSFVLKAGVTVVSFLTDAAECVFGRYDTVLMLRAEPPEAEAMSRAVGRKVSSEDIVHLPASHGWLIHLSQVYQVELPREIPVSSD